MMKNTRGMVKLPKIREPRCVSVRVVSPVSKQRHSVSAKKKKKKFPNTKTRHNFVAHKEIPKRIIKKRNKQTKG